jgi:hypothetical protein
VRSQHLLTRVPGMAGAVVLHDRGVAADILLRDAADRRDWMRFGCFDQGAAANPALVDALHGHHTQVRCTLAQLPRLLVGL